MHRIHADGRSHGQKDRSQDHDVGNVVQNHTEYQQDQVDHQNHGNAVGDIPQNPLADHLRVTQHGQGAPERGGRGDHKQDRHIGLTALHQEIAQLVDLQCLIDKDTDN